MPKEMEINVPVSVKIGESVYCEECKHYREEYVPYMIGGPCPEMCKASIKTKSSYRERNIPVTGKPEDLNANNDCKYFEKKPKPEPYFKTTWFKRHGFKIHLWKKLYFCVEIAEKKEKEIKNENISC